MAWRSRDCPQPERWEAIGDGLVRLRLALEEMYAYYRANEQMIANILRDLPVMPELAAGSSDYHDHLGRIWGTLGAVGNFAAHWCIMTAAPRCVKTSLHTGGRRNQGTDEPHPATAVPPATATGVDGRDP